MGDDVWASLADPFVEGAYATAKGAVRTYVLHQHLLAHLPPPPAAVLDVAGERGVLGIDTRADTVAGLSALCTEHGAAPLAWYGLWLFSDWLELDADDPELPDIAAVELAASRRDPYRALSRVFHLLARA